MFLSARNLIVIVIAAAALAAVSSSPDLAAAANTTFRPCAKFVKYRLPVEYVKAQGMTCADAETVAVWAWLDCDRGKMVKSCSVSIWLPANSSRPTYWTFECLFDNSYTSDVTYGRVCVGQKRNSEALKMAKYIVMP